MVASKTSTPQPAPATFIVQRGGHRIQLTYEQVFAAGHKLWVAGRYVEAAKVFERLAGVMDRGPRAHILLAHCKAMLGDYAGCSSTLSGALSTAQYGNASSDLHDIFVMWKCAFYQDVKQGLEKLVTEHPELPTPCLMLAEFLMYTGNNEQTLTPLQQAIERDRPDGVIAMIARNELRAALEVAFAQPTRPSAGTNRVIRKNLRF